VSPEIITLYTDLISPALQTGVALEYRAQPQKREEPQTLRNPFLGDFLNVMQAYFLSEH
jgi:hypothetical protein